MCGWKSRWAWCNRSQQVLGDVTASLNACQTASDYWSYIISAKRLRVVWNVATDGAIANDCNPVSFGIKAEASSHIVLTESLQSRVAAAQTAKQTGLQDTEACRNVKSGSLVPHRPAKILIYDTSGEFERVRRGIASGMEGTDNSRDVNQNPIVRSTCSVASCPQQHQNVTISIHLPRESLYLYNLLAVV